MKHNQVCGLNVQEVKNQLITEEKCRGAWS